MSNDFFKIFNFFVKKWILENRSLIPDTKLAFWPKMVKKCQKWPKMAKNGKKWSKMAVLTLSSVLGYFTIKVYQNYIQFIYLALFSVRMPPKSGNSGEFRAVPWDLHTGDHRQMSEKWPFLAKFGPKMAILGVFWAKNWVFWPKFQPFGVLKFRIAKISPKNLILGLKYP